MLVHVRVQPEAQYISMVLLVCGTIQAVAKGIGDAGSGMRRHV